MTFIPGLTVSSTESFVNVGVKDSGIWSSKLKRNSYKSTGVARKSLLDVLEPEDRHSSRPEVSQVQAILGINMLLCFLVN